MSYRSFLTRFALITCLILIVSACSSPQTLSGLGVKPLIPEQFFNGDLVASGVVKNRSGRVIRTFNADIKAHWQDGHGTLEEDFIFNDGSEQRRVWKLAPQPDGSYIGSAGDVTGIAEIRVDGIQMNLDYLLQVPINGRSLDIKIDDRMYLVSDDLLLNESRMTKFGITVGYIFLAIRKLDS